jgi:hypothetical protein
MASHLPTAKDTAVPAATKVLPNYLFHFKNDLTAP